MIRKNLQNLGSAAAYLISRNGAERLLEWSSSYCEQLDDFIFHPRPNWISFQLMPAVAVQGMCLREEDVAGAGALISSSERTVDPSINAKVSRAPFLYRLSKELRWFRRRLYWAVWGDRRLRKSGGFIGMAPLADDLGEYR